MAIDPHWCFENPDEAARQLELLQERCDMATDFKEQAIAMGKAAFNRLNEVESDCHKLRQERDALAAYIQRLTRDIEELISETDGVAGLHLNGEAAPWCDLRKGGPFQEWLMSLDEAPTTILARLKSEWQAEALDDAIGHIKDPEDRHILHTLEQELRRQAEGAEQCPA